MTCATQTLENNQKDEAQAPPSFLSDPVCELASRSAQVMICSHSANLASLVNFLLNLSMLKIAKLCVPSLAMAALKLRTNSVLHYVNHLTSTG